MKRRNFIKNAAALGAIPAMLEGFATKPMLLQPAPGFSLKIMSTNWGFVGGRTAYMSQTKADHYDGVELWVPKEDRDRDDILEQADKNDLEIGLLCGSNNPDFSKHLAQFEEGLEKSVAMKPIYINCHSGKDWFSFEENLRFIQLTNQVAKDSGIPIYHETHRGRMLFAAHVARKFMEQSPELRLTLDISHWCNVHESMLGDQAESVNLALSRTDHIHARIGHAEGPQVNDPRAPEWASTVEQHLNWWDKVLEAKAKAGLPMTILTEFGPPNYLPALPYTQQPVADQWGINVYMKDLLRKRYATG